MLGRLRQEVPDVLLVIAGEGPAQSHCRALVEALGLTSNVLFVGYLDRRTGLADCYSAADVFVFASRTETQGLVLLEALAQGTPVVSTAVMGTVDVLRDARGAWVVPEDEAAFAAVVAAVLTEPDRRATLSALARLDARAWSSRAMAERLLSVYESVIGGDRSRGAARARPGRMPSVRKEVA